MSWGQIAKSIFGDIANAIREQNGTATTYKPSEMAAAVTALDGTNEGNTVTHDLLDGTGVIDDAVFTDIADAIRGQNGLTTSYAPGEMAQVIRDLTWDTGVKMRALLHSDGVLEINYVDGQQSLHSTADVEHVWEVSTDGYSTWTALPWYECREDVTSFYIDSSVASVTWENVSYLCGYLPNVTDVYGLENLVGVTNVGYLFATDAKLETVWDEGFDLSAVTTGTYPFNGCTRLVGGASCTNAQSANSRTYLHNGSGGLTTSTSNDNRKWVYAYIYPISDGAAYEMIVCPDDSYNLGAFSIEGTWLKLVGNCRYKSSSAMPWYDYRASITGVTFGDLSGEEGMEDTQSFADFDLYLDYWFVGLGSACVFSGLDAIAPLSLYMTFQNSSLTTLTLTGLDPSTVTIWSYAFASSSSLTTITVDSTWALPSGLTTTNKANCFYGCTSLVGGNGTAWDSSKVSADMAVIDKDEQEGYLTAG